jgi:hypothetical protein
MITLAVIILFNLLRDTAPVQTRGLRYGGHWVDRPGNGD